MRKTKIVTITDSGRDQGKAFLLTEMPASKAEKWAARAILALAKSGVEIPKNIEKGGVAGIAVLGLKALMTMNFTDAEPLLDEMMQCVQAVPNPAMPNVIRPLIEDDIEEVSTRVSLRAEVFALHTNFSLPGAKSTLSTTPGITTDLSNTQTHRRRSGR